MMRAYPQPLEVGEELDAFLNPRQHADSEDRSAQNIAGEEGKAQQKGKETSPASSASQASSPESSAQGSDTAHAKPVVSVALGQGQLRQIRDDFFSAVPPRWTKAVEELVEKKLDDENWMRNCHLRASL